jgi:hypothetical protein
VSEQFTINDAFGVVERHTPEVKHRYTFTEVTRISSGQPVIVWARTYGEAVTKVERLLNEGAVK